MVQETTTFTLPNSDEYERPEEIREIEVNRVKARSVAVEGDALSFGDKLRASLLGQLNESMSDWDDRDLRRSFVHMQVLHSFFARFFSFGRTQVSCCSSCFVFSACVAFEKRYQVPSFRLQHFLLIHC